MTTGITSREKITKMYKKIEWLVGIFFLLGIAIGFIMIFRNEQFDLFGWFQEARSFSDSSAQNVTDVIAKTLNNVRALPAILAILVAIRPALKKAAEIQTKQVAKMAPEDTKKIRYATVVKRWEEIDTAVTFLTFGFVFAVTLVVFAQDILVPIITLAILIAAYIIMACLPSDNEPGNASDPQVGAQSEVTEGVSCC